MGLHDLLIWLVLLSPAEASDRQEAYRQATRLEDCQRLHLKYPRHLTTYECYWRRALKERKLGEGARLLEKVLLDDPRNHAARLYLGNIEIDRRAERALALIREATQGFATDNDPEGEFWGHMARSRFFYTRNRWKDVADALADARRVADASGDPKLVAEIQLQEGWQFFRQSKYARAWTLFKELEQDPPPGMRRDFRANALDGLAATSWSQGKYDDAFRYYQQEMKAIEPLGQLPLEADVRRNLAILSSRVTVPRRFSREEVFQHHRAAVDAAVRAGDNRREAHARLLLGQMDDLPPAEKVTHLEKTLRIFRESRDEDGVRRALRILAPALLQARPAEPDAAFGLIDEAIRSAQDQDRTEDVARGWLVRTQMRWHIGRRDPAVADSLTTIEAIESIRARQGDRELQARVLSRFAFAYRRLSGYLLDPGRGQVGMRDLELSFRIMERMRAQVLLGSIESRGAEACPDLSALQKKMAQVQRRLIDPALPSSGRNDAMSELERLELQATKLKETSCRQTTAPAIVTLARLRQALHDDQALLAYQLGVSMDPEAGSRQLDWLAGSWLLVVTREEVRAIRIAERNELGPGIQMFLGLLDRRDGSEGAGASRLFRWLLADALSGLPPTIRRLVVVPDGPLFQVPFGALRPGPEEEPLAARYQVSVAPSASLWCRWQAIERPPSKLPLLAFADPSLPAASRASTHRGTGIFRAGLRLGRLPYARTEVRSVANHLGNDARLVEDREASEHRLKTSNLRDYTILHLAAHAVVDDQHPLRSAVVLAAGSDEEDGLLQPSEIAELDMPGLVVILSTCSSARGEILEGEGMMSLARAFFQAGAAAVVGNLWPLRDDEAAALIEDFSEHLADGKSLGAALAATQREWIRDGRPAAAWAGLMLQGDADRVPFPGGLSSWKLLHVLLLLAGSVIVAGLVWWRIGRRRTRGREPL